MQLWSSGLCWTGCFDRGQATYHLGASLPVTRCLAYWTVKSLEQGLFLWLCTAPCTGEPQLSQCPYGNTEQSYEQHAQLSTSPVQELQPDTERCYVSVLVLHIVSRARELTALQLFFRCYALLSERL